MAFDPTNILDGDRFLTTHEYCALRRIKPHAARRERMRGAGPPFIRTGDPPYGRVLYRLSDVMCWLEVRTVRPTATNRGDHPAA